MRYGPLLLVLLAACPAPEDDLPPGPPVEVAYAAACDSTLHARLVTVEGYLHLFPSLLSCYPGGNAPSGRACQIKLLPRLGAPTDSLDDLRRYYTLFIEEGRAPNQADPTGFGFGAPVTVLAADSAEVDPYDRVRVTGRMYARPPITGGEGLDCSINAVESVEIAEAASPSWADEQRAAYAALRARGDSLHAATDSLQAATDSLHAATDSLRAAPR